MSRLIALLAIALAVTACAKPAPRGGAEPALYARLQAPPNTAAMSADASAASDATASADATAASENVPETPHPAAPSSTPMLAYSYEYGIEAPPSRIRGLAARRQAECVAAGPTQCQVTGSEITEASRDQVTAKLTLRAAPAWLKGYPDRLAKDASDAGGRLAKQTVTSEDLSRQIVDTEAAVRAKTALRDRLQSLLETHPGKIEDLLKVEEALANVQGELDATNSELATMRERIATSDVTIEYDSAGVLTPQGAWSPIPRALSSVTGIFADSLAAIIYVFAYALPWVLIAGGLLWVFRKRLPSLRRRARPVPSPADPPPKP